MKSQNIKIIADIIEKHTPTGYSRAEVAQMAIDILVDAELRRIALDTETDIDEKE